MSVEALIRTWTRPVTSPAADEKAAAPCPRMSGRKGMRTARPTGEATISVETCAFPGRAGAARLPSVASGLGVAS